MSTLVQNRAKGRFLKIQIISTYGDYGGLQFIGLTGRNMHSPGYKPGYRDTLVWNTYKVNHCKKEGETQEESDKRQTAHCQLVSFIAEEKSISTRCPINCACCKLGDKSKTSICDTIP